MLVLSVALVPILGCAGGGVAQSSAGGGPMVRFQVAGETGEHSVLGEATGRDPDRASAEAGGALAAAVPGSIPGNGPPPATVAPGRSAPGFARGVYGSDSSATGFDHMVAAGFNTVEIYPDRGLLDQLAVRGLRGYVWLGGWDNGSCNFEFGDQRVRSLVGGVAGHSALQFYYIGDEPSIGACPGGPAAFRARTALVHSLDARTPTFTVISTWDETAGVEFPYGPWVGTVDILGLDVYPCVHRSAVCNFDKINQAVAQAARVGLTRYYAVVQAFADDYHRLPSASELQEQFARWQQSQMEGYLVFNWDYAGTTLAGHVDLVAQLQRINGLANGLAGDLPSAAPAGAPSEEDVDEDEDDDQDDDESPRGESLFREGGVLPL
jgi:hypothetical protein